LEEYGGVYLDTDMYFIKPLNKLVGSYDFFISCEDENYISAGVIGCIPHHSFIREALTFYDKTKFDIEKLTTIPKVLTSIYKEKYPASSHDFSKVIQLDGGVILPKEYFYPFSLTKALELETNFKKYITAETFAIHLWNHSWFGGGFIEFDYLKKRKFFKSLQILVRRTYNNKGISRSYYTRFNQLFFKFFKKYSKEQLKLVSRKFFLSND
jgi:mannosyltransferase OCH1-like enzyme